MTDTTWANEKWLEYLDTLSEHDAKCAIVRVVLVDLNWKRLGKPDFRTLATLLGITDVDHLTRMNVRAQKASSWQEVLRTPDTWQELWQTEPNVPASS